MFKEVFTIQNIFYKFGPAYILKHKLSKEQWAVYNSIMKCKTKELGFHIITCDDCGEKHSGFNSCRNRHCPNCQFYAREKWIENESSYLLDCPYFHIVTTVPSELKEIALYNQKAFYNILLKANSEAILELADDHKWLGAKVGITSILHTWGQTLEFHPHVHSIITGGGLKNNKWISGNDNYLFKVKVLSSLFRGKVLAMLKHEKLVFPPHLSYLKDFKQLNKFLEPLYKKEWISYIEPPKGRPENVVEYIGRYAFRVAISDQRIKNITNTGVTFEYKDYKDNSKIKEMTISGEEFIRRFLMHVLPKRFTKIKHYGLLSNRNKKAIIKFCKVLIGQAVFSDFSSNKNKKLYEYKCPKCNCTSFSYKRYQDLKDALLRLK